MHELRTLVLTDLVHGQRSWYAKALLTFTETLNVLGRGPDDMESAHIREGSSVVLSNHRFEAARKQLRHFGVVEMTEHEQCFWQAS